MTKSEVLDFVDKHFLTDEASNKLKRIVLSTYTPDGYITYKNEKIEVSHHSFCELYNKLKKEIRDLKENDSVYS